MTDEHDPFGAVSPIPDESPAPRPEPPRPEPDADAEAALLAAVQACVGFPLNDCGNGQRFVRHFGERLMWVPRVGWFDWTGRVWKKDQDLIAVRKLAQQIGPLVARETSFIDVPPSKSNLVAKQDDIETELRRLSGKKDRNEADDARVAALKAERDEISQVLQLVQDLIGQRLRHAKSSGNSNSIGNMIIEGGIDLSLPVEDLDTGALDVNTETGVLRFSVEDLRGKDGGRYASVTLIPHDAAGADDPAPTKALRLTKMMPVAYDPEAEAPQFQAFMERIMPQAHMRRFLQRWFGLSMTGITREQKLAFFYGMGANGKSVLVDLMAHILGAYASTAKIESLTGSNRRGGGDATPDLVPLIGARMVRSSEPDKGVQWQEGLIKELTGGEPILVRALHSDFVEVVPKFKLTISGNHKPDIRGTDDGIWRRLLIVPFDVQIPKEERDGDLINKLIAEAPGVLNWCVQGLLEYLEVGLQEPQEVLAATTTLRAESDPYGSFLEEACHVSGDPDDSLAAKDLVAAFHFWLADRGEGQFKDRTVALALKERSRRWRSPATGQKFNERKSMGTMRYDGIRLTDTFRHAFDNAPKDHRGRLLTLPNGGTE